MRNHPIPRGRKGRRGDLKSKTDKYIGQNIAVARHILQNPDIHPPLTVEWARLTLGRGGGGNPDSGAEFLGGGVSE